VGEVHQTLLPLYINREFGYNISSETGIDASIRSGFSGSNEFILKGERMKKINLTVTYDIGKDLLKKVAECGGNDVKITDAAKLVEAEQNGDKAATKKLDAILADTDVICGFMPVPNVVKRAPKLKWHHTLLAGVDITRYSELFKSPVIVTNTHIHGTQISELVLEMMLMLAKHAPSYFEQKKKKKWERIVPTLLHSMTMGVVGLGTIGKECARLGKAFGMTVIATNDPAKKFKYADRVMKTSELPKLLKESDYVVLAVPLIPETADMIGAKQLAMMKKTAYLINISRGQVVDEDALAAALQKKVIAGAGLDVFRSDPGPLPANSKLWDLPNVVLSPHIAGSVSNYNEIAIDAFCANLELYREGKKMHSVVNKKKGY
jgi:phosphoglycerate dehydrogenase-like enzyme